MNQRFSGFIYGFITSIVILIMGCAWVSPSSKETKAEKKVTETKAKISDNKDKIIEQGKSYIFGAGQALSLNPQTNKYTDVAKSMINRAQTTVGEPSMAEMVKMTAIIEKLVSEKAEIVAKGKAELEVKDEEIINLQSQNQELNTILKEKEAAFVDLSRVNAGLADKWIKLKQIFWWIVYGFIFFCICKVLSVLLPPPYNSVFGICDFLIGGCIRLVFKLIPKAKETAKVVSSDVQTALDHVVTSVQETKTKIDAKNSATGVKSVGLEELKNELAKNTDDTTKSIITDTKRNLGYI